MRQIAAVSVAGALAVAGLTGCATGDAADAEAEIGAAKNEIAIQKGMREVVKAGFPGVMVSVTDKDGKTRDYSAGIGNKEKGEEPPAGGYIRAASNTKSFVAATVMQLVGEGKVKLDEPIDTYLPGLVEGPDYSGKKITVRNMLGHTSGIPDYTEFMVSDTSSAPEETYTAEELLKPALKQKAAFPVGKTRAYSNTNYILAGMLVEKITGKPVGDAVTERVFEKIGLEKTYWPKPGVKTIEEPHMEGYGAQPGEELKNLTEIDPSISGAAGMIISTPGDLNKFFTSVVKGEAVPPAQVKEMQKTVEGDGMPNTVFGLGLDKTTLSCGPIWGHGGDIHGYESRGGVAEDGRSATVVVNALPGAIVKKHDSMEAMEKEYMELHGKVMELVDTAICK